MLRVPTTFISSEQFREDVNRLNKEKLVSASVGLSLKASKSDLVETVIKALWGSDFLVCRFYQMFASELAIYPSEVEKQLGCTTAERKAWVEKGFLTVIRTETFSKRGTTFEYNLLDRYQIYSITSEAIETWRSQKRNERKQNATVGQSKAKLIKRQHQLEREAFKKDWKDTLVKWFIVDPFLGSTLQLAYWTVWISRWAKENQLKADNAITKSAEYKKQSESLYLLKNKAIKLLSKSPYSSLSFYRPEEPDKISLTLCDIHYHDWREVRENVGYMDKWDYFELYSSEIKKCCECTYRVDQDYYALFYLEVKDSRLPEYNFSFHTPFPIGKAFLPPKDSLPEVNHVEQTDSMFRFGRPLFADEKVIYTEKTVRKQFEEAITKFNLYIEAAKPETENLLQER